MKVILIIVENKYHIYISLVSFYIMYHTRYGNKYLKEAFEDTKKRTTRSRVYIRWIDNTMDKRKEQQVKQWSTEHYKENEDWTTRAPLNIMVDIRRPGRVGRSYRTRGTRRRKWLKKWHNCFFLWIDHKLK